MAAGGAAARLRAPEQGGGRRAQGARELGQACRTEMFPLPDSTWTRKRVGERERARRARAG